jgi:type III restriction enzyme
VETDDSIYIVEIKAYNRTKDEEVLLKSKAAREYCHNVNTLFAGTDRKPWKYMLVADSEITRHTEFGFLEQTTAWREYGNE